MFIQIPNLLDANKLCFAFDPRTDPFAVLYSLAWAYKNQVSVCGSAYRGGCPAVVNDYCLDCHSVGYSALVTLRERFPNWISDLDGPVLVRKNKFNGEFTRYSNW